MAASTGGFTPRDYIGAGADALLAHTLAAFRAAHPEHAHAAAVDREVVLFADNIIKVNRVFARQQRSVIVTNLAVLNFKPKKYAAWQRRIDILDIDRLWLVEGTNEIVHMWEATNEYDYRFDPGSASRRAEFVSALTHAHTGLLGRELVVETLDDATVKKRSILKQQVQGKPVAPAAAAAIQERRALVASVRDVRTHAHAHTHGHGHNAAAASATGAPVSSGSSSAAAESSAPVAAPRAAVEPSPNASPGIAATHTAAASVAPPSPPATPAGSTRNASAPATPSAPSSGGVLSAPTGADGLSEAVNVCVSAGLGQEGIQKAVAAFPHDTPVGRASALAEVLVSVNVSDALARFIAGNGSARRFLASVVSGVIFGGDADVRGWSTRSLWRLLALFKQGSMLQDEVASAGGFDGYVLKGWVVPPAVGGVRIVTAPVSRFEAPVYRAIMEILLDSLSRPSENVTTVETFGKLLTRPEELRLLFRLLPTADWELKRDVMKDMNVLLVKREENFPRILEQIDWMAWLAPLLANVLPRNKAMRSQADPTGVMEEYLKYVVNFFVMVFHYVFQNAAAAGGDIDRQLTRFMDQLTLQCGWTESTMGVVRAMLASLVVKIMQNNTRFKRRFDRPEWENLFKVATVVEDFIFYRPVSDAPSIESMNESAGKTPMMLYMPVSALNPMSKVEVAPLANATVDRSRPRLPLINDTQEGIDDLKLAQRVLAAFQELGLTPEASSDPLIASTRERKAKDMLTHASGIMKVYKDMVTFLESSAQQRQVGDTQLLENLGKYLEKRQKQQRTGFLSKTVNKKGIVQALQTDLMRQKAQQTVRTQVQAKMVTANAVTVEHVDEHASAATEEDRKPMATTAKRLQGTRAAVEQHAATSGTRPSPGPEGAESAAATGARSPVDAASGRPDRRTSRGSASSLTAAAASVQEAADAAMKRALASVSIGVDDSTAAGDVGGDLAAAAEDPGDDAEADDDDDARVADIICAGCSQPLLNDDGVAALGQSWHVNCFCCSVCQQPFHDKPFFQRRNQAYCRADFLRLYGRSVCAECMEPLRVGERAVAAVGRMYHPDHFCCEGCGKRFDPSEQVYERDDAPYCIRCNLSMFGTCAGCNKPIGPDVPAVSALGRNWHMPCISCSVCGCGFPDGVFFSHTDENGTQQAFCERDYLEAYAPKCRACNEPVRDSGVVACGSSWHTDCFVCMTCHQHFPEGSYYEVDGRPYCRDDYFEQFGTRCAGCNEFILDELVNALGKTYHPGHFGCANCSKPFYDLEYYEKDGNAYDEMCYCELFCPVCPVCERYVVEDGSAALGKTYHPWCLVCSNCGDVLTTTVHAGKDGKLYCEQDFRALCANVCGRCGGVIEEDAVVALEQHFHPWCFTCMEEGCEVNLSDSTEFLVDDNMAFCEEHFAIRKGHQCSACSGYILPKNVISVLKRDWHPECLRCARCTQLLSISEPIFPRGDQPHCEGCFMDLADKCVTCGKAIIGKFRAVKDLKYHPEGCLACITCVRLFAEGEKMYSKEGFPVCKEHATAPFSEGALERIAAVQARRAAAAERATV